VWYCGHKISIVFVLRLCAMLAVLLYTANGPALAIDQVGSEPEAFTLLTPDGKKVSLSDYSESKVTAILFWSTWSSKSPAALKRFEELHRKYGHKGMSIIGINADNQILGKEDIEAIKKSASDMKVTFPILLDNGLKTFRAYNVMALPSTVVISGSKVIYVLPGFPLVGAEDLMDYLASLMGDQQPGKLKNVYRPRYDAVADTNLAAGFVREKKLNMAALLLKKAITKDPEYIKPYLLLARVYEADNKPAEAEGILGKALVSNPSNVQVITELGWVLAKSGRIKDALDRLEKAVGHNSYTPSHYYYAYALWKDGRMKEALDEFGKALKLNPYDVNIYLLRAELYEGSGMLSQAASDYQKALELRLKGGGVDLSAINP